MAMKLERRDFLKTATTGLAFGVANRAGAFGHASSGTVTGELQAGSGTLRLKGRLTSGTLTLEAQDFLDRGDRSVVIRSTLQTAAEVIDLYSAMFSYDKDLAVFAVFHDNNHSTMVVCSDSDDPKIGRVVVWNDVEVPQVVDFAKAEIMKANSLQDIKPVRGSAPDLGKKRKPPLFTWRELETVFGDDDALKAFTRGRKSMHQNDPLEWICRFLSWVPGSTLSLDWWAR
jgi:hypothetical protein